MTAATRAEHWIYVGWPYVLYFTIVLVLLLRGEHGEERNPLRILFRRISWSLERVTGYPGWAMAGALSALQALGVAVVGLYWDVAYHIDFGRDEQLFTPSHTMIVLGLGGLVYAAAVAVIFATVDRQPVGFRVGPVQVPWSALALAALGVGGVAAFPLDNLWHEAYGIDVTLWSPTHLQLVAGGSLAPIVVWLMLRESGGQAKANLLGRGILVLSVGAILAGMSTFQGEFDFGVPQFQVGYLPLLIAAAAAFTLPLARVALGPWGAVKAVVTFLILRSLIALVVTGALNHSLPRFPLYLAAAVAVEAVAWRMGTERPLPFALAAGAAVGTVGVAADMVWVSASGWFPGPARPLPAVIYLVVPVAAVAAAVLGVALASRAVAGVGVPVAAVPAALAAVVLALAVPLPRTVGDVDAVIRLEPAGRGQAVVDVRLEPPDAAEGASGFAVAAWQGGGRVLAGLREVGPGHYVSTRAVPVTGSWKATVGLQRGSQVMAAPIYFPADPEIGEPAIPALPERRAAFVRNTDLLMREAHPGEAWPAVAAYTGLAGIVAVWLGLFALCAAKVAGGGGGGLGAGPEPSRFPWRAGPPPGGNGGDGAELSDAERLAQWRAAVAAIGRR